MPTISLFISSTFRDFHAERDLLVGPVRAALDDLVAPLGCRVEVIDLRWGVGGARLDDDERQHRVLDVCLTEITRARPLFVGLVGDRFGWVPNPSRVRRVTAEAGLSGVFDDWSMTAVEFEHGALAHPVSDRQAYFFLRHAAGEVPEGWVDSDREWVSWLRRRVAQYGDQAARVHGYDVVVDGRRVEDLSGFETLAVDVLGPVVVARARELVADTADPITTTERLFFEERAHEITGRDSMIASVTDAIVEGADICLLGPSGVGKSSVWCQCVRQLRRRGTRVLTVALGATPTLASEIALVSRLAYQLGIEVPDDLTTVLKVRDWWFDTVAEHAPLVIAVDALDKLAIREETHHLGFLTVLPKGISVLVTTADSDQARILRRAMARVIDVEPIAPSDVRAVVHGLADAMRRDLPQDAVAALASSARTPLWLMLAVGELTALDEEAFASLDPRIEPLAAQERLVVTTVRALPDDITALVRYATNRTERRFGATVTEAVLALLATTRSGLSHFDLAAITGATDLQIAGIVRSLAGMLRRGDIAGRLIFAHDAVRYAVAADYTTEHRQLRAHREIARHLARTTDADPVHQDDLLWHLLCCQGDPPVGPVLNALTTFTARAERAAQVLISAVDTVGISESVLAGTDDAGLSFCSWVVEQRHEAMRIETWHQLARVSVAIARRNAGTHSTTEARWSLSGALTDLVQVALRAGDADEAKRSADEAVGIARVLFADDPEGGIRQMYAVLDRAADAGSKTGGVHGARQLRDELLTLARRRLAADNDDTQAEKDLNTALYKAASSALDDGDPTTARALLGEAIEVCGTRLRRHPGSLRVLRDLASDLSAATQASLDMKDVSAARRFAETMLQVSRIRLENAPESARVRRDLSVALVKAADVAKARGKDERAHQLYSEALEIDQELVAGDPKNAQLRRDLTISLDRVGSLAVQLGDEVGGRALVLESLAITRTLIAADPRNAELRRDLQLGLDSAARMALRIRDIALGREIIAEALTIDRAQVAETPNSRYARDGLAITLSKAAELAQLVGDAGGAQAACGERLALRIALFAEQPSDPEARADLKQAIKVAHSVGLHHDAARARDVLRGNPSG